MATFVIFLGLLSILVLIHELGHFVAARLFGVKVEEFAFGLPFTPPIFKIKKGETQYSIYPLVFGGFVRLHGEDREGDDKKRSFWNRGKKQRLMVILAGVIMNVVLGFSGFMILYGMVGVPVAKKDKVTITQVILGSPAEKAGVRENDRIYSVEGKEIVTLEEFSRLMKSWAGLTVNLVVERGTTTPLFEGIAEKKVERKAIVVTPRVNPPAGEGALGVGIAAFPYLETKKVGEVSGVEFVKLAVGQSLDSTKIWMGRIVDGLRSIGQSLSRGKAPEGVSGPVGIYKLTEVVIAEGLAPLLELMAILSINLAVFNVLPIPALDGGRALFIILEWVMKKRISAATEQKVNSWGMAFLLGLMVLISLQDVVRLGFLDKLVGK